MPPDRISARPTGRDAAREPGFDEGSAVPGDVTERQREILRTVAGQGFATIEVLARDLDVSAQTVRRDVIRLHEAGLLQRFHGGAGLRDTSVRLGYAQKRVVAAESKERIGRAVAGLVLPRASVFLDVGTTAEAVARALVRHAGLRVFTSSMPAALALAGRERIEVFVAGGIVQGADGSLVGDSVIAALGRFRVDVAVIGCSGFDTDGAPMDFDLHKVGVKQAMIAHARSTVVVADASKFKRGAVVRVAPPEAIARLVTDTPPPDALAATLARAGVAVTIA